MKSLMVEAVFTWIPAFAGMTHLAKVLQKCGIVGAVGERGFEIVALRNPGLYKLEAGLRG